MRCRNRSLTPAASGRTDLPRCPSIGGSVIEPRRRHEDDQVTVTSGLFVARRTDDNRRQDAIYRLNEPGTRVIGAKNDPQRKVPSVLREQTIRGDLRPWHALDRQEVLRTNLQWSITAQPLDLQSIKHLSGLATPTQQRESRVVGPHSARCQCRIV